MNIEFDRLKTRITYDNCVYKFGKTSNIIKLKKIWNKLVEPLNGEIYLTYQYNLFCARLFFIQNTLHKFFGKSRKKLMFFYGVSEDNRVLIFPGVVDEREKKILFLGEQYSNGAGYNDFIGDYDVKMIDAFITYLKSQYVNMGEYTLSLHDISEKSIILKKEKERPCVRIQIRKQDFINHTNIYDLWYASMSKSSRQNLRTAYNRMKTDSVTFELKTYDDLKFSRLMKYYRLILKRSKQINDIEEKDCNRIIRYIKDAYKMYFNISFYMLKHSERSRLTVLELNKNIVACMITHKERFGIVVPKLAIDIDFSRYSPGCIMISEYLKNLKLHECEFVFDLSRGDERYKVALGGEIYYNYGCDVLLK